MKFARNAVLSCAILLPLASIALTTNPAYAQSRNARVSAPSIDGFNVEEIANLTPGNELDFTVFGTPGATVTLRIQGAKRNLVLTEVESGQYEGSYTISSRDTLTAKSSVTANMRIGQQVASAVLAESLQTVAGQRAQSQVNAVLPKIDRFDVQPNNDLTGGNDLKFTLFGTPGGKADMTIAGTTGKFFMPEVRSGEYVGNYTIKQRDRITASSTVTANLRVGDSITSATLGKPLTSVLASSRQAAVCTTCATVEAVNTVEVKGEGTYLGTIGGGVVGALIGSQVGGGRGKTAAEIAGALGGAYAGNKIEGNMKKSVHYETVVRMQNGTTQTISTDGNPGLAIGEKIRVENGVMTRGQ